MTERNETMLRLVLWRKRMTQADLARRTGIDPASVSRIVRGVEPAYPRRGRRIADALGWEGDPSELFEEVPDGEDR
ncbi:helix-turn-helix transcriptional regulator [uncultured Ellagibacter sp.]|uniref:helix-turn-helix domain-containing protein n=1 Tax=uncultured Ellagibacter sp. TaxID=2137580 RepID=UPI0026302CB3|nr:helix-turn-helix transcriptional regulator [uncultured Ellagibacter sp.]